MTSAFSLASKAFAAASNSRPRPTAISDDGSKEARPILLMVLAFRQEKFSTGRENPCGEIAPDHRNCNQRVAEKKRRNWRRETDAKLRNPSHGRSWRKASNRSAQHKFPPWRSKACPGAASPAGLQDASKRLMVMSPMPRREMLRQHMIDVERAFVTLRDADSGELNGLDHGDFPIAPSTQAISGERGEGHRGSRGSAKIDDESFLPVARLSRQDKARVRNRHAPAFISSSARML